MPDIKPQNVSGKVVKAPIPATLAPFFQEYDLRRLDAQRDSATIIERALQYGNRDFEAQTVKRLLYFENAEQDVNPDLLQPVAWQDVKAYFVDQSAQIGRSWLE